MGPVTPASNHGVRGVYDNFVTRTPMRPPPIPVACIRNPHRPNAALCQREVGLRDFLFGDIKRAVEFYAEGKTLRACPACVEIAKLDGGWQ